MTKVVVSAKTQLINISQKLPSKVSESESRYHYLVYEFEKL